MAAAELPLDPAEEAYLDIEARIQWHLQEEIIQNPFFKAITSGEMEMDHIRWAMSQYYHVRNHFHEWWGIAISNTSVDEGEPHLQNIASELAMSPEFADPNRGHYYEDFLEALGVDLGNIDKPTKATQYQIAWFPERYKGGGQPVEVLAALGPGNELHTYQGHALIFDALRTHHGVLAEDMGFLKMHIDGAGHKRYEWMRWALLPHVVEHGKVIEAEAKHSISETAKFWEALHSGYDRR